MFNKMQVESSFSNDDLGITNKFKTFINGVSIDNHERDSLLTTIDDLVIKAFNDGDNTAQRTVQNILFMIYQINLVHPLSEPATMQYDPLVCTLRMKIESKWLEYEFSNSPTMTYSATDGSFGEYLKSVWTNHIASHHELFDFLEKKATKEQLILFLKSDSALNLIFFDLVAYTLIGAEQNTRGTISENLWDEVGHGDNFYTHVNLYKDVLSRQDIQLPTNHYVDLYDEAGLAGHNAFMLGGINRKHYYKLLGVMAMTEVLDPPQYMKLVKGCYRLGLLSGDVHYYNEHITVDIKHGDDWLYKVIDVIVDAYPDAKQDFYQGSLLRLQTAERYYDQLLNKIKRI